MYLQGLICAIFNPDSPQEWDDKKFFESLSEQYAAKRRLSPKQINVLKKMLKRYAVQIPEYDQLVEKIDLPPRGKKKTENGEQETEDRG